MLWKEFERPMLSEFGWIDREFDQLFRDMWRRWGVEQPGQYRPAINVWMNDDRLVAAVELPGVDPADIEITLKDQTLTLTGKRPRPELDEHESYVLQERVYGDFTRSVNLPYHVAADQINAIFDNGWLVIELPRTEADKPRKIAVTTVA